MAPHIGFITIDAEALMTLLQFFHRRQTTETRLTGGSRWRCRLLGGTNPSRGWACSTWAWRGSPTPLLGRLHREEGPRKVHRSLQVGRMVHLHIHLDVLRKTADEEFCLLSRLSALTSLTPPTTSAPAGMPTSTAPTPASSASAATPPTAAEDGGRVEFATPLEDDEERLDAYHDDDEPLDIA